MNAKIERTSTDPGEVTPCSCTKSPPEMQTCCPGESLSRQVEAGHDHHDHDQPLDDHHTATHGVSACCPSAKERCDKGLAPHATAQSVSPVLNSDGLLLYIPAMDCPTEEGQIRGVLKDIPEIRSLRFDLAARTLEVDAPERVWDDVGTRIATLGFETQRLETEVSVAQAKRAQRSELIRAGSALGVALVAELIHLLSPDTTPWLILGMSVAAIAIGLAGFSVLRKGWFALTRANLNINALMTVAVVGAFVIGDWPEAAMVMALYSIAELIEARAVSRARRAIKGLLNLAPTEAQVRQPDGIWVKVAVRGVKRGAVVRVRPGERFAFDGHVLDGNSSADQSAITGESVPVEKSAGDPVFAGTVNQYGEIIFEVDKPASDTVLARIIHVVEQAQSTRAPIQRFVDRFAAVYTPAVFVMALLVAILGPLMFGVPWLDSIYKALVLLVIACPCALVISTPVTIVSGLTAAARMGVLIKGGVYLEQAHRLKRLALDKTGTLTEGKPVMVSSQTLSDTEDSARIFQIAALLAARSEHPVSAAIAKALSSQAQSSATYAMSDRTSEARRGGAHMDDRGAESVSVEQFKAEPGKGVMAQIDGAQYRLGNHRWIHSLGLCSSQTDAVLRDYEAQGHTLSLLANEQTVLAVFAVADTLRQSARQAILHLQRLGVQVVMLTGDNALTARQIAREAGIHEVRAELLPEDKLDAIRELGASSGPIGMVGDGINDSPALASADIGFAMGHAGTDIAMEAADVVIMNDDLGRIARTIELSRKVHRVLWQNISLALGIKAVFLLLAIFDHATMWMAVFADMGASLLVVFNGLRLIRSPATDRLDSATTISSNQYESGHTARQS